VDYELWEVKGRGEFWCYAAVTFLLLGVSRMICENSFILSNAHADLGFQLLHSFKAFQLVGVIFVGLLLILFRRYFSPSGMIIFLSFLMCAAQANMLNPTDDVKIETLLIITSILTAVTEGGYLTALCCYIHEEYG